MRAVIFANGQIHNSPLPIAEHDLLIAADGGARNVLRWGMVPHVLIGDYDSLERDELAGIERAGAMMVRFPENKDETDLELALDYALSHGAEEITLYGLFGGRWDMTFANLLLLAGAKYAGVRLVVIDNGSTLHILRSGGALRLNGSPGDIVSVLPLAGPAEGVSYEGLTWPLVNAVLPFGTPRGVSNTLAGSQAQITLKNGTLLVVHQPLPVDQPR